MSRYNVNSGISLTKRDFRLQKGNLAYKMRFSLTKRESCRTNGNLNLQFSKNMLCMTIVLKKTRKYVINNNIGIVKWKYVIEDINIIILQKLCYT